MEIVFLPIKPKYVNRILIGEKKWEYRKSIPRRPVQALVIYSSSPEKKIKAFVLVETIISGTPTEIWERTERFSGIEKDDFFNYFCDAKVAYAIRLGKITPLSDITPADLEMAIPQSFAYLSAKQNQKIQQHQQLRVFVGGIHGSGKTSFCNNFIGVHNDFEHISSSSIIEYSGLRNMVTSARRNQLQLIEGIENIAFKKSNILIDGHFALLGKSTIQKISVEIFRRLKLSAVCLLLSDPFESSKRIRNRDGENIQSENLAQLQIAELENAMQIARNLNIHLIISNSQNEIAERLLQFIASCGTKQNILL